MLVDITKRVKLVFAVFVFSLCACVPSSEGLSEEVSPDVVSERQMRDFFLLRGDRRGCTWQHGQPGCAEDELCVDTLVVMHRGTPFPYPDACYRRCENSPCLSDRDVCRVFDLQVPPLSAMGKSKYMLCVPMGG